MRKVNLLAKAALFALVAHAALFPDLEQYQGKGMPYRIVLFPISALVVPLVWWFTRGRRDEHAPYPDHIDLCLVLPFLIDLAGNAANLYDTVTWWDDLMHVVTWIPLVSAFGLALRYRPLTKSVIVGLTIGFGAVVHILWEVGEYLTFVQDNPNEALEAYRDTIGDLVGSLAGSCIGAALVVTVLWAPCSRWYPSSALPLARSAGAPPR